MLDVRPETPDDFDAIRALHDAAFAPSDAEAKLVDQLRADGLHVPELCFVATAVGELIGHVLFSRATLDPSGHEILVLAPMGVLPGNQRRGIGAALGHAAIERAKQTGFPLVSVLGHPGYYPRLGFGRAAALGITARFEVPDDAWMAMKLPAYTPEARGTVRYPAAFDAV
jgi:putative acetyltransferase